MASNKKVTVKLLVDMEKSRVVLAEADNDFVDILFSFLTLPLGTILRLLGKQPTVGCMNNLYDSVENFDTQNLQTEACKTMLLRPRSAAAFRCEDLKLNIDDPDPRKVYTCRNSDCCSKATCCSSFVDNTRCPHCREIMDGVKTWWKGNSAEGDGVFVNGGVKFMISDDLYVTPASTMHSLALVKKLGIRDGSALEERTLDLGTEEILILLKKALVSKAPLTDMHFLNTCVTSATSDVDNKGMIKIKTEGDTETKPRKINAKLILNKANNKVVCAEAGEDLVNLVFSFLTFPLGSVVKFLEINSSIGCVDNLYRSVQGLSLDYIKSEECKSMLLSPKLAPFFSYSNQLLKIDEMSPKEGSVQGCFVCYWNNSDKASTTTMCLHGVERSVLTESNPKSDKGGSEKGGGYAKRRLGNYMMTDNLLVSQLSPISTARIVSRPELFASKLVEVEAGVGEVEVRNLSWLPSSPF